MTMHGADAIDIALAQARSPRGRPVADLLLQGKRVDAASLPDALGEAARLRVPAETVLAADDLASRSDILDALAQHHGVSALRRAVTPPDPALADLLQPEFCLRHAVLPWRRIGGTIVLATARPDAWHSLCEALPPSVGPVMMAVALEDDIHAEIAARHGAALARRAETWRAQDDSCRTLETGSRRTHALGLAAALGIVVALAVAPTHFFAAALGLALLSLVAAQGLKIAALVAALLPQRPQSTAPPATSVPDWPDVSLLVPLFREEEIAETLVKRLSRLRYPKARLDVVLVLEAEDAATRAALSRTALPSWMRVVEVPPGAVTTKPRALNYAFRFCRGDIVGIYDAEDSPAPDQIDRVVARFRTAPDRVACLQGVLDFYNPRANWLSRCFAIEYASWFRILLPGLARMGFPIPLGGTTVFFRRAALERAQGWDAHNVTEDADLGIRLARLGYVTALLDSVTNEEANNRFWPWIKQRSRWLKGYALTWWVHSRRPRRLWRDLGGARFAAMQLFFVSTLLQFALAPVLWSFWLILFGLPHPLDGWLSAPARNALIAVFLSAEAATLLVGIAAVARSPHTKLFPWVPTMVAYFPLGSAAIYKALWEAFTRPFYWDKTQHGQSAPDADIAV